jgi:glycosyltransferase involved in cell wall biosynthesis
MTADDVTPVILTFNEAPNIERCLRALAWARRIVVLDSGSTDATEQLARRFDAVHWLARRFDNHCDQWNHAIAQAETDWVLTLDCDYVTPAGFVAELATLPAEPVAWYGGFRYLIEGVPLRGTLYPPRAVLFRRSYCRYRQDGHTQLLEFEGEQGHLASVFDHDDRKPLSHWLTSQYRYAALEAEKLSSQSAAKLRLQDKVRSLIIVAAPLTLIYTLFVKLTILDGRAGLYYALQRTTAELLLSLFLLERRLLRR